MKETRFKQTDIGLIPEDWDFRSMGKISKIYRGGSPRPISDFITTDSNGINWIKIGDVDSAAKYINCTHERIKPEGIEKSREVYPGDLILSNSMSFGRPYILNIYGCIHDGWLVIQDYNEYLVTDYLYYILGCQTTIKQYIEQAAGSSVKNLNKDKVANVLIPFPTDPSEQQRIADALGDVDILIATLERLIEKKRMVKQGTMQQLLTGKLRLPGFNKPWVEKSIGKHCSVKARIGWQGLKSDEYLRHGDYFLVGGTDFKDGRVDWANCKYVSKMRFDQDRNIQLKLHDCLISKDGTIGKVAFVDELVRSGTLNSGVFVVRSKDDKLDQSYLSWIFLSPLFNTFIKELVAGSTIMHLYQKDIVKFSFFVPSDLEEQRAIAKTLTDMDAEIAALESKLLKYKDIKSGMMQQLLTGKIRLI